MFSIFGLVLRLSLFKKQTKAFKIFKTPSKASFSRVFIQRVNNSKIKINETCKFLRIIFSLLPSQINSWQTEI